MFPSVYAPAPELPESDKQVVEVPQVVPVLVALEWKYMKPESRNCPPPPQDGLADWVRLWKKRKPRFFPAESPIVPEHGPNNMFPSMLEGTPFAPEGGAGDPAAGHCSTRERTLPVPDDEAVPSIL